jgi:RNA polymerase sigma-70 factor (ECF subfamily)
MNRPDDGNDGLIESAAAGDTRAMGELFAQCRDRLRMLVRLRMDRRVQGRVDPSDILQETFLEASQRIGEFARKKPMPFFLWLRFLTAQRLIIAHRRHLGAQMRDAAGEVSLYARPMPEATSVSLAAQLLGNFTSPDQAAVRAEMQLKLQQALNEMEPMDREVLAMRHFEQLSNGETAQALGISKTAASNRYVRALARLRDIMAGMGLMPE